MDVGLDEAGRNQPTAEIDDLTLSREAGPTAAIRPPAMPMSVSSCSAPIGRALLKNDVHCFFVSRINVAITPR